MNATIIKKYTKLYQNPFISLKVRANDAMNPSSFCEALKPARVMGINMSACAKMIGITLAAFTFRGMY